MLVNFDNPEVVRREEDHEIDNETNLHAHQVLARVEDDESRGADNKRAEHLGAGGTG
jgi:hypothetical protein